VLVADRGPGLGRASASRRAGQGVGLPLVRKFAQDSGGRLWSHNREGGGAMFGLWLPVEGRILARLAAADNREAPTRGVPVQGAGHGRASNGLRRI
jgi:hypothetical protein